MRLLSAALLVLAIVIQTASSAPQLRGTRSTSVTPFYVGKDDPMTTHSVSTVLPDGQMATCTFSYATGAHDVAKQSGVKDEVDPKPIVEALRASDECVTLSNAFYRYDVCLNGNIKQSNTNVDYNCGEVVGITDDKIGLNFDGGTTCDVTGQPRKSRVDFVCHASLALMDVEEVGSCAYNFYVGTPDVCGVPRFNKSPMQRAGAAELSNLPQRWYMEIAPLRSGDVQCLVQDAGMDNNDASFKTFSLSLSAGSRSIKDVSVLACGHTPVPNSMVKITSGSVEMTPQFKGDMHYVRATA